METFRDILCRQVDTLQSYFDACSDVAGSLKEDHEQDALCARSGTEMEEDLFEHPEQMMDIAGSPLKSRRTPHSSITKELLLQHGVHAVDFKGEAITFKATTAGILATLSHCIEMMTQREDSWRKRLEKEVDKRKRVEDMYRQAVHEAEQQKVVLLGGPDYEEGPHSAINEEEFYDAVETGLDKIEEEEEYRERLRNKQQTRLSLIRPSSHHLWEEIERITLEQVHYARLAVGEGGWQLFAEDGEMRMYKREEEVNGMVVDPLKAVHTVKGVSGHEMCYHFFNPDVRLEWETTLEHMNVLEKLDENTLIFHQIHRRVWPASQRDSLFWSHIRRVPNVRDQDAHDIWIVCNHSTDHSDSPANQGKCLRVQLTVCLVCQTFVDPPQEGSEITRENVTCKITYCSVVNPGGWAPASVLRAVYKREYPKFLKRFTSYVIEQCKDKEILY